MKLFEAFCSSLFWSLLAGALLFVGLPLSVDYILSDVKSTIATDDILFFLLMYIIYVLIQLILSILNVIQANHLLTHGELKPDEPRTLHNFIIAEISLYLIVFVIIVALVIMIGFAPVPAMIVGIVILFSIPYVICCTGSVFIFRFFLRRMMASEAILPSVRDVSNDDPEGDTSQEQVI